jgi:hypothetical protein
VSGRPRRRRPRTHGRELDSPPARISVMRPSQNSTPDSPQGGSSRRSRLRRTNLDTFEGLVPRRNDAKSPSCAIPAAPMTRTVARLGLSAYWVYIFCGNTCLGGFHAAFPFIHWSRHINLGFSSTVGMPVRLEDLRANTCRWPIGGLGPFGCPVDLFSACFISVHASSTRLLACNGLRDVTVTVMTCNVV